MDLNSVIKTVVDHSHTGLVRYSDPHCTVTFDLLSLSLLFNCYFQMIKPRVCGFVFLNFYFIPLREGVLRWGRVKILDGPERHQGLGVLMRPSRLPAS